MRRSSITPKSPTLAARATLRGEARRALEVNARALDQHRNATAEWESPELRDFADEIFGADPEH